MPSSGFGDDPIYITTQLLAFNLVAFVASLLGN